MQNLNRRKKIDPLFQIFDFYLNNKSHQDSSIFTKTVANTYLSYLDSTIAHVPYQSRSLVLEDLQAEVQEMLVKKMYGAIKASDYSNFGTVIRIKKNKEIEFYEFFTETPSEEEKVK